MDALRSRSGYVVLVALLLGGCAGSPPLLGPASAPPAPATLEKMSAHGAPMDPASPSGAAPRSETLAASHHASGSAAGLGTRTTNQSATTLAPPKRIDARIMYTGDVRLARDEASVAATLDNIVLIAESFGGYLAGRTDNSIRVKVPSADFRAALSKIDLLGNVTSRSVTAEDVSAEYHDLETRLQNLKASRKRIEEFMARATSIAELMTVEKELERVATEIDVIQGRLQFLKDRTSFSMLTVTVDANKPVAVIAPAAKPPAKPLNLELPWLSSLGITELGRIH